LSSVVCFPSLLGAASEFWMTRWLTTFWLAGLGIVLGFALLLGLIGLFFVVSRLPFVQRLQTSGLALWFGLVLSIILTASFGWFVRSAFDSPSGFNNEEWWLSTLGAWPIFAVISWTLVYACQQRFLSELKESLTTGVGGLIFGVLAIVAGLGLLSTPLLDEPLAMLQGIPKIFAYGESRQSFEIPGQAADQTTSAFEPVPLKYDPRFVNRVTVNSNRRLILADSQDPASVIRTPVQVEANVELAWTSDSKAEPPIPLAAGLNLFAQNLEVDPATLVIRVTSVPAFPETISVYYIAAGVVVLGLAWMLPLAAAPRLSAISISAAKNELSQPLPIILLILGSLFLLAFVHLPYYTGGEDIKMLKDCGLTLILVLCLFQGVWSASSSVSDEIEGRTALTLMSKPIHRRSFIIGKMLGVFWVLLVLVLILGAVLLFAVAYKPIVDARETQADVPLWQDCHREMMHTIPGLLMVLLQATTLSTLSVALATRLPQLANFAICFTIYLVGHLTPAIVDSTADAFPIIQFVAQLTAVLIPTLDWFSMDKAIDSGQGIPGVYLAGLFLYSILYTAVSIFLGLLLFEDRDLA
jgi:hypothetical protein